MMECHEAQRLISERLDDETLDSAELVAAKEHCRTCPECGAFVRALVLVQRHDAPLPPAGLPDRIIAAVREEAAAREEQARAQAQAAELAAAQEVSASQTFPSDEPLGRLLAFVTAPRNRRAVTIWASAAVVLLVVGTVTAISGVRQITSASKMAAETPREMAAEQTDMSALSAAAPDDAGTGAAAESAAAPSAIVVSGSVYYATGPVSGVDTSTLSPVGSTRSSLDAGGSASVRQVLGVNDPARVYVVDDTGQLLGFDRVVRQFHSRTYVLTSGELLSFGMWPTLPPGVSVPSNPNGMPEYVAAGTDDLGVEVYRPAAGDSDSGFVIAPGTSASDPAGGNPGWTWWVPAR